MTLWLAHTGPAPFCGDTVHVATPTSRRAGTVVGHKPGFVLVRFAIVRRLQT